MNNKSDKKKVEKKEKKTDLKAAINSIDSARIAHKEQQAEEKKAKENKTTAKSKEGKSAEDIEKIISEVKAKGKITYGELASKLGDASADQIDEVFKRIEDHTIFDNVPEYYRDDVNRIKCWFKVTRFEKADNNIMSCCYLRATHRPLTESSRHCMNPYFKIEYLSGNVKEEV